jgi:hypothetical protein
MHRIVRFLPTLAQACASVLMLLVVAEEVGAQDCCDPAGPFALGEDYPKIPATCATIGDWAARAPNTDVRISLAITGKLSSVKFDGTLALLEMCEAPGVQVLCVTYSTNSMKVGDTVMLAGGFNKAGEGRIVLDPCLASRE